ncbi:hypothetical protein ACOSP7_006485 [Xanthoceras sorbifolium]
MKKDKVGFKYTGTSLNNASRAGGFRFDILNYLAENNCEEGVIQKSKGVDLKQKEVLTEVTNLKEKIRVNKKFDKSKVSSTVRDGYYSQKKSGTASSKAKKQLMHNTSSGNEKQPLRAGIFEDIIHDDRVDNSQSVRDEVGVPQQLHRDIKNATKTNQASDFGGLGSSMGIYQPTVTEIRSKIDITKANQSCFEDVASKLKEAMLETVE